MWNTIMMAWVTVCSLTALLPTILKDKNGKRMTWRELFFFIFGIFVLSIPLIYMLNS